MFCRYCGKELEDDSRFCSKCGKQLVEEINVVTNNNSNSKKIDTVKSYEERAFPLVEDASARVGAAAAIYNVNRTNKAAFEKVNIAALNYIEVFLDYYKGLVKIQGDGDYSEINQDIEHDIEFIENGYINNKHLLSLRTQDQTERKLSELRTEWRKIRQL